jgi:hypothetical protein
MNGAEMARKRVCFSVPPRRRTHLPDLPTLARGVTHLIRKERAALRRAGRHRFSARHIQLPTLTACGPNTWSSSGRRWEAASAMPGSIVERFLATE